MARARRHGVWLAVLAASAGLEPGAANAGYGGCYPWTYPVVPAPSYYALPACSPYAYVYPLLPATSPAPLLAAPTAAPPSSAPAVPRKKAAPAMLPAVDPDGPRDEKPLRTPREETPKKVEAKEPGRDKVPATEATKRTAQAPTVLETRSSPAASGTCRVGFWNLSGHDVKLTVEGRERTLARDRAVTLDLPRGFRWQADESPARTVSIPAGQDTHEVVIR